MLQPDGLRPPRAQPAPSLLARRASCNGSRCRVARRPGGAQPLLAQRPRLGRRILLGHEGDRVARRRGELQRHLQELVHPEEREADRLPGLRARDALLQVGPKAVAGDQLVSGGEPILQKELPQLAQELLDRGYQVSLETHGQRPLDEVPRGVRKIVDLKTPGSKEPHTDFAEFKKLQPGDEVKVVVTSSDDFRWAVEVIDRLELWGKLPVLFSPSYGEVQPQDLAQWLLQSGKPARLQLQLHKLIWGAEKRGV